MVSTEDIFIFEELSLEDNEIKGFLSLKDSMPFFEGHFPDNPVLPAVSMVDASLELLRKKYPEMDMSNIELKRCKFMKMVRPDQKIIVKASSRDQKQWKVSWESSYSEEVFAHLNLIV